MPLYTTKNTIKVRRGNKPHYVEPNVNFEFTEEEAATALASSPGCLVLFKAPAVKVVAAPVEAAPVSRGKPARKAKPTADDDDEDGEI
jgi:hypothetical protein